MKVAQKKAYVRTRFPPEPNGYLHIGHAKSIYINFELAKKYGGVCHLRFDDTNPEKEAQEYVDSIIETVRWLGFNWKFKSEEHLYFASDYFNLMYQFAYDLTLAGHAYVDEQNAEKVRINRGTLVRGGTESPWRNRPVKESLRLLSEMKDGKHPDGSYVLRAKVNMASPNINLRDPIMYRIRHASHHRTKNHWCIYPTYSWAHPIEDALESVTYSICTLEFEDQRPFYEWVLERLFELNKLVKPLPRQIEFSRLNLNYIVTSKRKLSRLVQEKRVDGWDDPRMPTLVGLRRRGYTPSSIKLFCKRIHASKSDTRIEYDTLEQALRDDLEPIVDRAIAILRPIKLIISNYPSGKVELCSAPRNPYNADQGQRIFPFSRELWIEKDDFREDPPRNYFRLFVGNIVRLKYAYLIRCTHFMKNKLGDIVEIHAEYLPDTRSGTLGASKFKVKGNITWISAAHAIPATFNLYDRLFLDPFPDFSNKDLLACLNPTSKKIVEGWLEPGTSAIPGARWQFERLGYFTADYINSCMKVPVINRTAILRNKRKQKSFHDC